jgi:Domain of unknown function (DUF5063)
VDAVERFAAEAVAFHEWAITGTDSGADAARNGLVGITRLYLAALELPPPWAEELADQPDAMRVGVEEWRVVHSASARLPLSYYGEVFDPLPFPSEEPVIGDLADDIADIYRDVVSGLREYQAGRRAQAVWEWGFGFRHHWGEHATGAIRALHCLLASNAFDRLAAKAEPLSSPPAE